MRKLTTAAILAAAALVSTSAPAQERGGQATETQVRRSAPATDLIWNLVGARGLLGLTGFWRRTDNDGYTDDPI